MSPGFDARRAAWHIAVACGVLALPSLGPLALDARQLLGESVRAKPLKGAAAPLNVASTAALGLVPGSVPIDGAGHPLLGRSSTGGDLRVPHFVATRLLQALALAGGLLARAWPARARAGEWGGGGGPAAAATGRGPQPDTLNGHAARRPAPVRRPATE
ncbi:MAG: hypothetical protein ACK5Y8_02695 [Betaproteobacteria bacterium]|jgi:hypothetical protein|nr:hypothetical protein [Rubrivivax sp.]